VVNKGCQCLSWISRDVEESYCLLDGGDDARFTEAFIA